jgi:predicted dehydrogenase/threonine dehydrogenase-like Zn-dependent dehydrogenase
MKQILQSLKSGDTELVDVPTPQIKEGHLLIRTLASVVSVGTERMLVDFGKANVFQKARQQPDKVRQAIDKIKTDGIIPTVNAIKTKLDQPIPLGYSNAGIVIGVGKGVEQFSVGDRVVSNGHHAEIVSVPKNLCAKIPANVDDESAAFTVIGSIGLQGIRLAQPSLGESFVVTGLGLIGLLTVQLLKAHGCRVLAIDFDENKLKLAEQFGAQTVNLSKDIDPIEQAKQFTHGRGMDGVIITASTTSNEPIQQAAQMCRKRGRIILVGVTGLELSRADFYEKELSFQVSCSYGPGRYDQSYEEKGLDYPLGFVRWTEQRNFEAFLDMIAENKVIIDPLVTKRFSLVEASGAYQALSSDKATIGLVINYPINTEHNQGILSSDQTIRLKKEKDNNRKEGQVVVGLIGAGNFTNQVLLPALKKTGGYLKNIASTGGINGVHVGKRFDFEKTTTSTNEIIHDSDIEAVFITTRHNSHAKYVKEAIIAGKHVFVEKPLCLNTTELSELKELNIKEDQIVMVGFNRRFSPHVVKMKELLATVSGPKTMVMIINAGALPESHWTQDPEVGGGRVIGEACHFIDLLRFLAGSPILKVQAITIGDTPGIKVKEDKITISLSFTDGSIGTIHYFSNGHKSYPKEKLDVFVDGKILSLDNFKTLRGYGWSNFNKMKLWSQDKGHQNEIQEFMKAIKLGQPSPIPIEEIFEVTATTFEIVDQVGYKGNRTE